MVRFVVLVVAMAALVAVVLHFGGQSDAFAIGVDRPFQRPVSIMAFAAVGLIGWRLGSGGLIAVLVGVIGGAALAAFLTGHGLELPETRLAGPIALAMAGTLAAWPTRILSGVSLLVSALVGITHGHLLSDGFAAAQELAFLGGVAVGAAALTLGGCLAGEALGKLIDGLGERLGAGLAGVGVYLTLLAAGIA